MKRNEGKRADSLEVKEFILKEMPTGVLVFDEKIVAVYSNREAERFIKRRGISSDIINLCERIFDAIRTNKTREVFPGEVYLYKKFEGSTSDWTFKFVIQESPGPLVYLFIMEQTVSSRLKMNEIRIQYRLTRRETDVLRRVISGLTNSEIAEDFEISEQTVKDHLSNIYAKLGIKNRFGLISGIGPPQS